MKLARVGESGEERTVVRHEGVWFDLGDRVPAVDRKFLESGGIDAIRSALSAGELSPIALDPEQVRFGSPVDVRGAVITVATNYFRHAHESGRPVPEEPVLVFKAPSSITGPHDVISIPARAEKVDWEAEVGIVIGTPAFLLDDDEDPLERVAGFVCANDVAERDWQFVRSGNQWGKGKSYPSFTPIGPWLVTPDEVQGASLSVRSWVNGEPRQDSTTDDLIFSLSELVRYASQFMRLDAGDLILSGTPEGVAMSGRFPYLQPDDVVEVEVGSLGRQRNRVVRETSA